MTTICFICCSKSHDDVVSHTMCYFCYFHVVRDSIFSTRLHNLPLFLATVTMCRYSIHMKKLCDLGLLCHVCDSVIVPTCLVFVCISMLQTVS